MNLIYRRWRLGGTSVRGIKSQMTQQVAIIRNDGVRPDGKLFSYVTKQTFAEPVDYAFRWGCNSRITAKHVINSVESLNWCTDKRQGRLDMQAAGVSVPKTWAIDGGIYDSPADTNGKQYVGRPRVHAQGRKLVSGDWLLCADTVSEQWGGGYVSELINKVAEYRVAVIQNRVAWVAKKTPGDATKVAWNVAQGGSFANVPWEQWPIAAVKECMKAAKVSGCDFCGVDVMVDADGKAFVLEVNSAPSQTSPYRQGCFAKCFDYIIANGKTHFPDPEHIKTYKSVIHPAVREARNGAA